MLTLHESYQPIQGIKESRTSTEKLLLWWVVLKSSCAHYGVCMQGLSEVDPHAENCVCINRTADKEKNQTKTNQRI